MNAAPIVYAILFLLISMLVIAYRYLLKANEPIIEKDPTRAYMQYPGSTGPLLRTNPVIHDNEKCPTKRYTRSPGCKRGGVQ